MPHDRNAEIGEAPDSLQNWRAAFQLDGVGAAFSHQPPGGGDGVVQACIAHERHVRDDQGVGCAPHHSAGVIDNVVDRHGQGRVVALNHHAQAVANHKDGQAGPVRDQGRGIVIGGQHGDFLASALHGLKVRDGRAHDKLRSPYSCWADSVGCAVQQG